MTVELSPEFPAPFDCLMHQSARYKVFYGGRGGGKSHAIAKALVCLSALKKLRILCTREFQNSITDSVHRLISDQIDMLGMDKFFNVQKTTITSSIGSEFIFKGLARSIQEIKSTEGVNICWLEEAQNTSETSYEILIPTIREPGSEIWVSFNPEQETDPTYRRFIASPPPDAIVRKVNWSDNPFFPEVLNRERLYMLSVDPEGYQHVWEGFCRQVSEAQIFKGKFVVESFDDPPDGTRLYYGVDWGFSQDPTAIVRSWIAGNRLHIDHEAYGVGVEIDHLPELFRKVPGSDVWPLKADNARPETISHMRRKGFAISAAEKWKGSVEDGIAVLKGFEKIVIHPRCRHTAEEFRLYQYKIDKQTNEILPIVEDMNNHCIDALRYSLTGFIRQPNFFDSCHDILDEMVAA